MRGPPPPPPPPPRPMPIPMPIIGRNDDFGAIVVARGPAPPIGAVAGLMVFGLTTLAFAVATFLFRRSCGLSPTRPRGIVGPLLPEPVVLPPLSVPVDFGP